MAADELLKVRCPECETLLGITKALLGSVTNCPECNARFAIANNGSVVSVRQKSIDYSTCKVSIPTPLHGEEPQFTKSDIFDEDEWVQHLELEGSTFSEIFIDDLTPKGNPRAQPLYICTVQNEFLGKIREVKKTSREELIAIVNEQIEKWNKQQSSECRRIAVEETNSKL